MITKIIVGRVEGELAELVELFGTFYIASRDSINKELQKYKCPIRLSAYLDELIEYKFVVELDETEVDKIDCIIDISSKYK